MKGIRRLPPLCLSKDVEKDKDKDKDKVKNKEKVAKRKKTTPITAKSVTDDQFYSLLELQGVSRDIMKNPK